MHVRTAPVFAHFRRASTQTKSTHSTLTYTHSHRMNMRATQVMFNLTHTHIQNACKRVRFHAHYSIILCERAIALAPASILRAYPALVSIPVESIMLWRWHGGAHSNSAMDGGGGIIIIIIAGLGIAFHIYRFNSTSAFAYAPFTAYYTPSISVSETARSVRICVCWLDNVHVSVFVY